MHVPSYCWSFKAASAASLVRKYLSPNFPYANSVKGLEYLFNDFDGQQGTVMTYDKYRGRLERLWMFAA